MKRYFFCFFCLLVSAFADENGRPATLKPEQLRSFFLLPMERQILLRQALELSQPPRWLKYVEGGADPAAGGFDCSGAMVFVMKSAKLDPPRTSQDQWDWLKREGRLNLVSNSVKTLDDPCFSKLRPGDLLFWAIGDRVHHVAMFLGNEAGDNHAVALHSTDGRSYRGVKANGYGVFDLKVPSEKSESKLVGYGTPPGLSLMAEKLP
ncbi:MAG: hypothetical protein EAZ42_01665 [Verrucomicrobia bacterium]|nr:MAG: hypothetical protein EAZ42_01665 [Verrucomicrobiota bacterium]